MARLASLAILLLLGRAAAASPIGKVLQLITDLQAKIVAEGEEAQRVYSDFSQFCNDRSRELANDIKVGKASVDELKAVIAKNTAEIEAYKAKVEELSAGVSKDEADLKAAISIRSKEKEDFDVESKELSDVVDMIGRAISVLEMEMAKASGSFVQLKDTSSVTEALNLLVQANAINAKDGAKLTALVQEAQESQDGDSDDMAAPEAAAYEGHSGNIIGTLERLGEKAKQQLAAARQKETSALHNFELLKQSLEDEIAVASKDLAEAQTGIAGAEESKASAQGNLATTKKDLQVDQASLDDLHRDCLTKAQDFDAATKSRGQELEAIAKAKEIIAETTGASEQVQASLRQAMFLQFGSNKAQLTNSEDLANYEAIRVIRDVARREHSTAMAQLAARAASLMHLNAANGEDPFAKVKGLISDMIERLLQAAEADASHKAYCDKELGESMQKKAAKERAVDKLSAKAQLAAARSAKLKEEIAALQKSLSEIAGAQAEMDMLRGKELSAFNENKAALEQGLEGVKMALKVLRDYYASASGDHESAEAAGSGIIGLLEVCESDLSKNLAEIVAAEESAKSAYKSETKENEVQKTIKTQDVKYKEKEVAALDKQVTELTSDLSSVQAELDAVLEYLKGLDQTCIAKAETYEERSRRREAEMAGLKQALSILEGEAVFLEQRSQRRALRGAGRH